MVMWLILKMQRLLSILVNRNVFHWFDILTLIFITLCIDCASFQKDRFERISKYWKFRSFLKKVWFSKKKMHSYVFNVCSNRNSSLDLMKNCNPFSIERNRGVRSLHNQRLDKINWSTRKPQWGRFSFFFCARFSFFLLVYLWLYFFALNIVKLKEITTKL